MERFSDIHYIPGRKIKGDKPLERYLPPFFEGVATKWLTNNIPKNGWLLDPFGASPDLPVEAARSGYRVIVSANNPVTRFVVEILADPPTRIDFQSALAMLASLQVGKERLEPHIKSLYETNCSGCNQLIVAETFLWQRGESSPYAKIYSCPHCGDSGERSVNSVDIKKAESFTKNRLHRSRALERVAPLHDPDRRHVEEALDVYLPRSIYALITIINKLNGIPLEDQNHRLLNALLLLAFDRANTLWLYPKERQRPKQLTTPSQFREHNIWNAMESAVDIWISSEIPITVTRWPEPPPPEGGICLFEGRIKELATKLPEVDIKCILTAFPRPNQAFKSVLRRRRYDWGWHAAAISGALGSLSGDIHTQVPYFGLITEVEPGFLAAIILGAQQAELDLCGVAMRLEDKQAQITWRHHQKEPDGMPPSINIAAIIQESASNYLQEQRGEPSPFHYLHAAGLSGLAKIPSNAVRFSPNDYLSKVQSDFHQALSYRNGFLRFGGSEKTLEIGQWWIKTTDLSILPLADRVEMALVTHLLKSPGSSLQEIDSVICETLPGLTPPETELVHVCLQSYGIQKPPGSDHWYLQDNDAPDNRREDIQRIANLLLDIGNKMGLTTHLEKGRNSVVHWINKDPNTGYDFNISASALLGKFMEPKIHFEVTQILVIPGSRANLVAYKLKQNNHLQQRIQNNIKFIKFRLVRQLTDSPNLRLENLDAQFSLDPLTYTQPQIRFL